jgi:TRAP-type C4-dicarboxylate transport system permease small subunit
MGYATYRLIADDIGQRTPAAEIPVSWVYVLPLIGFFLTALRAIMVIVLVDIREMARGREEAA